MKDAKKPTNDNSRNQATETLNTKKNWKTPKLRILSVPAETQGGPFTGNDADDAFYSPS